MYLCHRAQISTCQIFEPFCKNGELYSSSSSNSSYSSSMGLNCLVQDSWTSDMRRRIFSCCRCARCRYRPRTSRSPLSSPRCIASYSSLPLTFCSIPTPSCAWGQRGRPGGPRRPPATSLATARLSASPRMRGLLQARSAISEVSPCWTTCKGRTGSK